MVKSGIKIFSRLRPTKKATGVYSLGKASDSTPTVSFSIPRSEASGTVNNKKELYSFRFSRVFEQSTKQDEVFEIVAQGVIDNCLEGYNGTIFAYGQTGSGKTFTITGGAERYSDRGIIPRTLSYLFQQYEKSPGTIYSTHVSYLEIYNESGYDLLDPKHEASRLEDLPKVSLMEDSDGNIHLKNLSLHQTTNEEEALNWLFLGDTNRMIAETPMNMASTRSHCIFTIHIGSREPGSDVIRKAKLHLVDLAGSERVSKSGVGGTLLTEAKYINLSLHFLEQVIVALSEKSRSHIPYRNSMMTSVLRDSLGGNCMTTMIATCSVEKKNIDETISTCRFAQRVALVKNEAILNEELDPKLMVSRLKQQVQELKEELVMATGEERSEELTPEERDKCHELVESYLQDASPEARLLVGADMRKIQLCFQIMKAKILEGPPNSAKGRPPSADTGDQPSPEQGETRQEDGGEGKVVSDAELLRLRELLKQRDDEISILLKMLKQEKRRSAEAEIALKNAGLEMKRAPSPILGRVSPLHTADSGSRDLKRPSTEAGHVIPSNSSRGGSSASTYVSVSGESGRSAGRGGEGPVEPGQVSGRARAALKAELSQARQEAFDSFRRDCADTSTISKHKKMLKVKYAEAKGLGERVNSSRMTINKLKSQIEQHRVARGVQGLAESSPPEGPDPREEELKTQIESEKANFKHLYGRLRDLKTEIEHIQHLLEKAKMQLQKDFEQWWTQQLSHNQWKTLTTQPTATRAAWRTPPSSSQPANTDSWSPSDSEPPTATPTASSRPASSRRSSRSRHGSARVLAAKFSGEIGLPGTDSSAQKMGVRSQNFAKMISGGTNTGLEVIRASNGSKLKSKASNPVLEESTDPFTKGTHYGRFRLSGIMQTSSSAVVGLPNASSSDTIRSSLTSSNSVRSTWSERTVSSSTERQPGSLPKVSRAVSMESPGPLSEPRTPFGSQSHSMKRSAEHYQPSIPLTGDSRADADIIAFYKARQKLIQKGHVKM